MPDFNINKIEEKILKFWDDRDIFARSLKEREGKKRFVFFEGPPTANGKPGIHHFIGRIFKDLWPRYKTMRGYYVLRKGGWDTHGLPVEIEVEKELGLKNKKDIEKYGIAKFNAHAKASVWKYKDEWQKFTKRIGFWLDLKNPYITYDPKYMESLWWIIQQIDKRGLLYEGHKVLPWCPRCGTALSSHEVAQGYQEVTEISVYVKFKTSLGYLLAWTTTPWTLPGNVALAVGEKIDYVLTKEGYILAKDRAESVLGKDFQVVKEFKGKDLIGLQYEPLFDIKPLRTEKAHRVYPADFVTTTEGTGIVHTAVMYGEDDYVLGTKFGLPKHHTVHEDGTFTKDVPEFGGQYVKDAEKGIVEYLKVRNLMYKVEPYTHSYPFCWRCKHALLYYARNSWFVEMSKLRKELLKNNNKINWYPEHLKEGRFGEFLREVKDWAFSRERYWGTPLPVWKCTKCTHQRVIGSLEELEQYRYRKPNTFTIVRHGFSTKNRPNGAPGIISSLVDHDTHQLTEEGKKQARDLAEELQKNSVDVDIVVSSEFRRARETAEIIAQQFSIKVAVDPRLNEMNHGLALEGKSEEYWKGIYFTHDFDAGPDEGETNREVQERMAALVCELNQKYEGKRIILVSHGDPVFLLMAWFLNLSNEEIAQKILQMYPSVGSAHEFALNNFPRNEKGELDLHRPYIDEIVLKCEKCDPDASVGAGGEMWRVKEVCDVWYDSGSMPFAQWHYPFENEKLFKDNFPAEFIAEAIDQTRGWFYTLLAVSTLLGKGTPYKNVVCYSHVLDDKGKKMSKSVGNIVNPWDVIEQYGVDATRWYFYSANNLGDSKLFAMADVGKRLHGFIMTLMNSLHFFELYDNPTADGAEDKKPLRHTEPKANPKTPLDYWILSRLHSVIDLVTKELDQYNPTTASRAIETFVTDDLSNWWIRRSRNRFQRPADEESFRQTLNFLRYLLAKVSKLCAPFTPFIAEHMYKQVANRKESVHLEDWPRAQEKYIDKKLEEEMSKAREIVAAALAERKRLGIKVRQPLTSLTAKYEIHPKLAVYIKDEVNVKQVLTNTTQEVIAMLDEKITLLLAREGLARELMRRIQDLRKEAKYQIDETITARWRSEDTTVIEMMGEWSERIAQDTLLSPLEHMTVAKDIAYDVQVEFDLAPGARLWLGLKNQ